MRIRHGLIGVLIICFSVSCEPGCSVVEQQNARSQLSAAFETWRDALDYMDKDVAHEAMAGFLMCAEEASICIGWDSTAVDRMEYVMKTYTADRPETESIREAEAVVRELESVFIFRRKL